MKGKMVLFCSIVVVVGLTIVGAQGQWPRPYASYRPYMRYASWPRESPSRYLFRNALIPAETFDVSFSSLLNDVRNLMEIDEDFFDPWTSRFGYDRDAKEHDERDSDYGGSTDSGCSCGCDSCNEMIDNNINNQKLMNMKYLEELQRDERDKHMGEQRLREQQMREQRLKEQQMREQRLKEQQMREQRLKEQQMREQRLGEQQIREQRLKEQQMREHRLKEQQMREQLEEQQMREQRLKEQQMREQRLQEQHAMREIQKLREQHKHNLPLTEVINLQVEGYFPEEITIKLRDGVVFVSGHHICSCNENCNEKKFERKYTLPHSFDPNSLSATIDKKGDLILEGVRYRGPVEQYDRDITVQGIDIPQRNPNHPCGNLKKNGGIKLAKIDARTGKRYVPEVYEFEKDTIRFSSNEYDDDDVSLEVVYE
ncbi:unnamed protein product [Owenia fusiformis]|uniref:Uncharacterized protein n=1 Tax=Owenia fusiformis TaxID=6347 RepID=A0A8J1XVF6_OWEFU|nr:unnamed protein product [Owenia fusiformis]